jgi:GTP-binding protein Era
MSKAGQEESRSGLVALVGRPNVGKSTLINGLLGEKVSIVTRKPQTTRHRIIGVDCRGQTQLVYVDTPGLHHHQPSVMNRYLNRTAEYVVGDVDVVVLIVEAGRWTDEDESVLARVKELSVPVLLAINKVDRIRDKRELLPIIDDLSQRMDFAAVVPISATRETNLAELTDELTKLVPEGPWLYPPDQLTDRSRSFMAAELVREQLMEALGDELPYATTVAIEAFEGESQRYNIAGVIWVEREGQKKMVIGEGGKRLKGVGSAARRNMESLFEARVHLELWVKVREGWSNDERALQSLGYAEFEP